MPVPITPGKRGAMKVANSEFTPGLLEAHLSAIGKSAPAREWVKIPVDYFAHFDSYLHGTTKKK
jgi:hypothetical protein